MLRKSIFRCAFFLTGLILFEPPLLFGQKDNMSYRLEEPDIVRDQYSPKTFIPDHINKKPGHYTITDWQNAIDSTWGWGLTKSQKLSIFDTVWNDIDDIFACFMNHPDYWPGFWDSLGTLYRTEIENGDPIYGVSRGRFAAIMNYLTMALKENHTKIRDDSVNLYTALNPGVPLLVVGPIGDNGHFGAGVTPLPDSTLLVYKTVTSHPLGLVPGDIILGYDNTSWKDLYTQLIDAQLPIYLPWRWASNEIAYHHMWLMSAGMNWHLFDTLDVVKYSTGDTVHLSVDPLIGQYTELFCSEQMDIPGISMPDFNTGTYATYGIIPGTQIGYIYCWAWLDGVEQQFYNAVKTLTSDYDLDGLIIDYRLNYGGAPHLANRGHNLLFNKRMSGYYWSERCSPENHMDLCGVDNFWYHFIYGSANKYFDKPIAVLVGPGAGSAGDFNALTLKLHPMARFFGKPTAAAYNLPWTASVGFSGWYYRRAIWNSSTLAIYRDYLTRLEFPVDEDVWLAPADVAQGYDTVVEAAKSWINSQQSTQPEITVDSTSLDVTLDYGETAAESLTISNSGDRVLFYSLTPIVDSGGMFISSNPPIVTGHGGHDNYGYTWIDSDQPHGPSFEWVDITGVGTPVSLGDDSYVGPIDIGFDFAFYGDNYAGLYICSNGLITFGAGSAAYTNTEIPNSDPPNNFIAPWWDDLRPNAGGSVYYYSDTDNYRFIVSFVGIPRYQYSSSATFQVILHDNGQIEFNYVHTEIEYDGWSQSYSATVGIENYDGSDGLQVYYNAPYTIDSLSILITTDWIAISPYSNYITPGENKIASVTFSARHLGLGTYTGNIYLDSNDPVDSLIIIPVSLTVTGGCDFSVGDVNGSDSYNGLDITYGVNFFKYGSPTPQCPDCPLDDCDSWHYCGDVNGSCNYNGLDITYGVNYFKFGSPAPLPCPDCPPLE